MKCFVQIVVLLVLVSVSIARVTPRNKFEEGLLKLIEKCKSGDVQSLPMPFPSLKHFKVEPMELTYDGFTMALSEGNIDGMENLSVEKLTASPSDLNLSMELSIPTLTVQADRYHLQGKVWIVTIDKRGRFMSKINNLRAQASVQFGAEDKDTVITHLNLNYSVGKIEVNLTGSSGFVNSRVKSKISEMLVDREIKEKIENVIKNLAREYLRGHTPQEFVEKISAM